MFGKEPQYVVLQTVLKESWVGTGVRNLSSLEKIINNQAKKGYRLHTATTSSGDSKGPMGGDRMQVILIFEKI